MWTLRGQGHSFFLLPCASAVRKEQHGKRNEPQGESLAAKAKEVPRAALPKSVPSSSDGLSAPLWPLLEATLLGAAAALR